jgi:hypothetical protein
MTATFTFTQYLQWYDQYLGELSESYDPMQQYLTLSGFLAEHHPDVDPEHYFRQIGLLKTQHLHRKATG